MAISIYSVPSSRIVHNTKVDIGNGRFVQNAINIVQYDRSLPIIAVQLYKDNQEYTIADLSSTTIKVRWGKRDHTFVYKDILGCDSSKKIVYFDVDQQMSYFDGPCNPILEITITESENTYMAGSSPIPVTINRNPIQETDIQSSNEYIDLEEAVADAQNSAADAEAYAIGSRGGDPVAPSDPAYNNNAKHYAEVADSESQTAEAWAVGKRNGTDVPSTDPTYHNNSKYWAEQCDEEVLLAEAWAKGTKNGQAVPDTDPAYHNNAKYWSDISEENAEIAIAIRDGDIPAMYSKMTEDILTNRQIDNPELSCPPITFGTTGGDAEIQTGNNKFKILYGKSKKWNQLIDNGNFTNTTGWTGDSYGYSNISASSNILNVSYSSGTYVNVKKVSNLATISGHKYLLIFSAKAVNNAFTLTSRFVSDVNNSLTTSFNNFGLIVQASSSSTELSWFASASSNTKNFQICNVQVFDLTAIYGAGNEPTTVADFKKDYPLNYYDYNKGTILSAKSSELVSVGENQWDEEWELGKYNATTGLPEASNDLIRSKSDKPIRSLPNTEYYCVAGSLSTLELAVFFYDANNNFISLIGAGNTTFTTPANCAYMRFFCGAVYGTTYNHDISIYICWDTPGRPYVANRTDRVTLPNIELRSVGDYRDEAYQEGGGKRYVGAKILKALDWSYSSGYAAFTATISDIKPFTNAYDKLPSTKMQTTRFTIVSYASATDLSVFGWANGGATTLYVRMTSASGNVTTFLNSLTDNDVILYELATPTDIPTSENPGWTELVYTDNYGTLQFLTDPAQIPQVEQPYYIEYTVSLTEFLDATYAYADGDVTKLALKQEVDDIIIGVQPVAKANLADNLSTDLGSEQTYNHLYLSGLNIGVNNGDYAKNTNILGKSYAVNQQFPNVTFADKTGITGYKTTTSVANNELTVVTTASGGYWGMGGLTLINGHKYILNLNVKTKNSSSIRVALYSANSVVVYSLTTLSQGINTLIYTATGNYNQIYMFMYGDNGATDIYKNGQYFIDLTQFFGSNANIPADLLAHPETFFNYYQGDLSYNTGTLKDSKPVALVSTSANVWDEVVESGRLNTSNGATVADSDYIRSKNYILVTPNTTYYFKKGSYGSSSSDKIIIYDKDYKFIDYYDFIDRTLTMPSNAKYIKFHVYGTTYNNNICINISDSSFNGTYVAHQERRYPLTLPTMRSAGSVQDNTSKVKVGTYTFTGNETWTYRNNEGNVDRYVASNILENQLSKQDFKVGITSVGLFGNGYGETTPNIIETHGQHIYVTVATGVNPTTVFTSGNSIRYELYEYIDQEGITLPENVEVFTNGTLMIEYAEGYEVPCDAEFLYQVNIKRFIEGLGSREDINWNKDSIVSQTELDNAIEAGLAELRESLEKGEVVVGKSFLSDNFDSNLIMADKTPYLFRTSGGALEIANTNRVKKIIGGSLPIIQLAKTLNSTNWSTSVSTATYSNGVATFTAQAAGGQIYSTINLTINHKYLVYCLVKTTTATTSVRLNSFTTLVPTWDSTNVYTVSSTNWQVLKFIISAGITGAYDIRIRDDRTSNWDAIQVKEVMCLDLTQTFGTTVANRLYALEQAQAGSGIAKAKEILVKDYYPYNVSAFTHVKTSGKVNTGFNQFDLATWLTQFQDTTNVANSALYNKTLWVNECGYVGRVQVVRSDFVLKSGAAGYVYIRFDYTDGTQSTASGNTTRLNTNGSYTSEEGKNVSRVWLSWTNNGYYDLSNGKMCISLYWDGERDGEYEDYQEWSYPTEDIELKGIISLNANDEWVYDGDEYNYDGMVAENYDEILDLGDLQWTGDDGVHNYYSQIINQNLGIQWKSICPQYIYNSGNYTKTGMADKSIGFASDGRLYCRDDSVANVTALKAALKNVRLVYQKSTPTQTQATPFQEQQQLSNWGTEKWVDDRDVPLPVASYTEYLPDLKAKLEVVPESPDEDGTYVMVRSDGQNAYSLLSSYLSDNNYKKASELPTIDAVGGTLRQLLVTNVVSGSGTLDFLNTDYVDLGTLNWNYDSDYNMFWARITTMKDSDNTMNLLCPLYKTASGTSRVNGTIVSYGYHAYNEINVFDNRYTDTTTFKNAMKGVLLAYEKASS